jgi:enediyne biosynthesis protein E4
VKNKQKNRVCAVFAVALTIAGGSLLTAEADGSIDRLKSEADDVMSMRVYSSAPETSTVWTATNLIGATWANAVFSTASEGPFETGTLPGTNTTVYVPAVHPVGFFRIGGLLPAFVEYTTTADWSSQTVHDPDRVTIRSNATVTLDQDDTAHTLTLGSSTQAGSLRVDQPYDLSLTDSVTHSNGLLHISNGSLRTPVLSLYGDAEVRLDGGALDTDTIQNDGLITVDGGTLGDFSERVTQPVWIRDRFAGDNQSPFATNDTEIAQQIGRSWKRCNPADDVTQYRISGGKLDIGAVSDLTQKASLVNTEAETISRDGETGFRLSAVMQQDHQAGSGFMGLIFNYQEDGSYYLFRVNGVGTVQFLVYSQFAAQSGTVLNVPEAFSPVQNRLYQITVESVGLHTFNLSIVDTVTDLTVYSADNVAVGGSYVKLDDGIGGVYATASSAAVDDFELIASPSEPRYSVVDGFTDRTQGSWATNDAQIARQIGSFWKRCNPVDEVSQYRINDGKLDIGARSPSDQKASLVNTAVQTAADGFRLSVVQQQDTTSSSGYMGLIFNFQEDGSYYLLRVSADGAVQFLVYSQYEQLGTVLSTAAFTPVQNRPYKLSVESAQPQTFDIRVIDTVTGVTVYSNNHVTVDDSFVKLQDGLGGIFVTHGLSLFDNFHLDAVPSSADRIWSGSGSFDVQSGMVDAAGGSVSHLTFNSALMDVSGGSVSLGQVSVGTDTPTEFRVTGDAAAIEMVSLNQGLGVAESGTFRFVFDPNGISPIYLSSWMDLAAAQLTVDGSAYTGGPARFMLFDSDELIAPVDNAAIAVSGFSGPYEASIKQDANKVELVYKTPDLFEDVTVATGLDAAPNHGWACWFDLNHDEWIDLAAGGRVWVNNGGTNFTDAGWVGNVVAADFDNDGWTDLFSHTHKRLWRNNQGTLEEFTLPAFPDPYYSEGAVWGDWNNDGWVDLYVSGYENWTEGLTFPDLVLMNNNGQSFTLSTISSAYRARGVTACDFDQDHDLDIYVSNYRLQPNVLWRNDGSGNFSDVASAYNVLSTERGWDGGHSIGNCWGDFDNDGLFDLFSGNFSHRGAGWGLDGIQPESDFFRNRGPANGYYFEDLGTCGVYWQESYASPAAGDVDNDGRLDLFFTTAYETATSGEPNSSTLFRNESDFSFAAVDDDSIAGLPATYQAAWGDYNNDGQLDLMTAGRLLKNRGISSNNWLKVRLEGDGSTVNRSAIGAQVRITLGTETLSRQVEGATGRGNQNSLILHFGLGQQTAPVDLEIIWPDGTVQTVNDVAPNQLLSVTFGDARKSVH